MAEKKVITKKDWQSNFTLIGKPKISEDYTFKIDEKSEKSSWIYNSMNIGIDCGEKYGVVYAELMGGYSDENENKIFAHGKNDDGSDNFEQQILVDWDDRFNDEVLEEIGDLSFLTVGLEKTSEGKTFYKKFLSAYDAIAYIKEHLTEDMVVNVRGNLKYSEYNGNVQVRKNITSIALSKADDASKYAARFTQTILIDKDSASLKPDNIDKDKSVMYVNTRVLDYVKEVNGVEVKGQYPYNKRFEFAMDFSNEAQCKKIMEKLFKVKKGVTQVTFEGDFVEGGAVVTATWDDLPDEIKDLVEMGVYTQEEALAKCTANGGRERRMVLKKPMIKLVGEDKVPVLQKFDERYTEDDLVLDYLYKSNSNVETPTGDAEELPFNTDDDDDSMAWLKGL
jgi:glutaredoxin 2